MENLDGPLKALDAAIAKSKTRDKKRLAGTTQQLSTHLVLLKLSTISTQIAEKLSSFLRESLRILYAAVVTPALQLTSAIFESVYHERILPAIGNIQQEQRQLWESVLHALLSGVLDFLDVCDTAEVKDAIGETLLPVLCDISFSLTAPRTGVDLRSTAYNVLIDAAASHQSNQQRLRDAKVLGGQRLGSSIWRTKDYLALEGLLSIFARALPSTNNTASGRGRRTAFIQSVFKAAAPSEYSATANEIAELLEHVPTSDWEATSEKIVDVLSKGNISCPQPFCVQQIVVNGEKYPSDRLYADDKTFLANVLFEDDQYESLEIPYTAVTKIDIELDSPELMQVSISLRSPPRLGRNFLRPQKSKSESAHSDNDMTAAFVFSLDQQSRFMQTLQSRELKRLICNAPQLPQPKSSIAIEPARLELDSAGKLVPKLSQSERVENLSQFYRTDEPSDDISSDSDTGDFPAVGESLPDNILHLGGRSDKTGPTSVIAGKVHTRTCSTALNRSHSQIVREAAFGTDGDDDLSDISVSQSPLLGSIQRRTSTTASLIRGRISFEHHKPQFSSTRVVRGGIGKVVLDSDDDAPPAQHCRPMKKTISEIAADNTSVPITALPISNPFRTPPPQEVNKTIDASEVLDPQSGSGKVLRFTTVDISAPDFNAPLSSPSMLPKAVLKSALVKLPKGRPGEVQALLDSSPPRAAIATTVPDVAVAPRTRAQKSAALGTVDVFNDLVPPSSSPTPGAKKSIKAALRKKDPDSSATKPVAEKPAKRKSPVPEKDDDDDNSPLVTMNNGAGRPRKRARTSTAAVESAPKEQDVKPAVTGQENRADAQLLRPSIARPTRKYRARKGRASSLVVEDSEKVSEKKTAVVDYDALPSPPRPAAAFAEESSPPVKKKPATRQKAESVVKMKTKAEAKTEKREPTGKEKKASKDQVVDSDKLHKADESQGNVKKTTKADKLNGKEKTTTETKTDKAQQPENDKSTNVGDTKKTNTTTRRVPHRPRKAGTSSGKKTADEAPAEEVLQQSAQESASSISKNSESPSARTVARIVAVNGEQGDSEDSASEPCSAANMNDAVVGPDPIAPSVSKIEFVYQCAETSWVPEPETIASYTGMDKEKEEATSVAFQVLPSKSSKKFPHTKQSTKKSDKTPWDIAADEVKAAMPQICDNSSSKPQSKLAPKPVQRAALHDVEKITQPVTKAFDTQVASEPVPDPKVAVVESSCEPKVTAKVESTQPKKREAPSTVAPVPLKIAKASLLPKLKIDAIDLTGDSFSQEPKQPQADVVIIDLTRDSPAKRRSVQPLSELSPIAEGVQEVQHQISYSVTDAAHTRQSIPELGQGRSGHQYSVRFAEPKTSNSYDDTLSASPFNPKSPLAEVKQEFFDESLLQPNPRILKKGIIRHPASSTRLKYELPSRQDSVEEDTAAQHSRYDGDPSMQAIVEVIDKIHNVIVRSMENKFEGVRHEARVGRDELLRYAAADLQAIRADSVVQFNKLVDLEAEYATIGRNVIRGTEDLMKVNQEICKGIAGVLEKHDRGMLSKRMPTMLIPLEL